MVSMVRLVSQTACFSVLHKQHRSLEDGYYRSSDFLNLVQHNHKNLNIYKYIYVYEHNIPHAGAVPKSSMTTCPLFAQEVNVLLSG